VLGGIIVRKVAAGLALGLVSAGLVLLLGWWGALDRPELITYDWRIRNAADPDAANPQIVLVVINDTTIRDLAPAFGRWPWPRVAFSYLLDYLNRAPTKVTAVDLTFTELDRTIGIKLGETSWSSEESDAALVDSVRGGKNVVLLADAVYEGSSEGGTAAEQENKPADWSAKSLPYRLGPSIAERHTITPPFQELTDAAALLGHNWLALDSDGPARRMAPFIRNGARYLPSFGVAAALLATGVKPDEVVLEGRSIRIRDRVMPLVPLRAQDAHDRTTWHEQMMTLINYRAPALTTAGSRPYKTYEARHLLMSEEQLQTGQKPLVDPAEFKDKIVFVGLSASGLLDIFNTPFGLLVPGIQIHASMADSILSNKFIRPAPESARLWTTVGFAMLVGLMAALLPYVAAAAGALLIVSGWIWYSLVAFDGGLWVNMAQPLLASAVALFAGTAYQYFVEGYEKRVVKKLFGRYVSKDVFQQLVANPELAELGGKRREMSVLFSDIRGFTTVTERGDPEELVSQLNEYFSNMVAIVFRHQGTVDKFVGDMVMALFGAPLDDPDHAEHAAAAAVEMVKELGELNRKWAAEGRAQLDIGIGINSGEMIAGNIGSSSIMSYTVIGDNVNLGARLESLNKDYETRIIISDATRSHLRGKYEIRPLGDVVVKGKTRPVAIFEIVVPSPLPAAREEVKV
jgi:adenylate cyclase